MSFYNARGAAPLFALLDQIRTIDAGVAFDLTIVVNRELAEDLVLPATSGDWKVLYRENMGYNIGAWHHGWSFARDYRYYLFLQDECQIEKPNWLGAFVAKANAGHGLIGESLIIEPTIRRRAGLPAHREAEPIVRERTGRASIGDWTHVQTTIVFATAATLERTGGFIVPSNHKLEAICCEVAFSMLAHDRGFPAVQLRFLPFEYISHPQWTSLRSEMKKPIGRLKRVVNMMLWVLKMRTTSSALNSARV